LKSNFRLAEPDLLCRNHFINTARQRGESQTRLEKPFNDFSPRAFSRTRLKRGVNEKFFTKQDVIIFFVRATLVRNV
jgi:hypothetical protein